MSMLLPTELQNDIFRRVERNDLATLARVSRLFQQEAEDILYHRVDLRSITDGPRLASWCMSIVVGERHGRRASRVHTLRLADVFDPPKPLPGEIAITASSSEIRQLFAQAFKAVVNLKELHVLRSRLDGSGVCTMGPLTLKNCTFRLTGIVGWFRGLTVDEMWEFLSTQPDISYWIPADPLMRWTNAIPPNTLPSLREMVLTCPKKLPLFYGRPIRKLVLTFQEAAHTKHDGLPVIRSLRLFKDTLRALTYMVFGSLTDWTTMDVIRALAQDAPNLELLRLYFDRHFRVRIGEQKVLVEAISHFQHLHSLVLPFSMAALHYPNSNPPDPLNPLEHDTVWTFDYPPAQSRKVASMFMESCPSLQRISFPFRHRPDGLGEVVNLCYGRSRSGGGGGSTGRAEAWLEGFYEIDSTSWGMR